MDRIEEVKVEMPKNETERCGERRDWERSEWFRRWLELINGPQTQGAS